MHEVRVEYTKELYRVTSKKSKADKREKEFAMIPEEMEKLNLFQKVDGRDGFKGFEDVSENIHIDIKSKDVVNWTKGHIKKFGKHGHLHTDHILNVSKH